MSDILLTYRGRPIRATDVAFLRELIAQNPALSRRRLSVKVCEAWHWVQPNGQLRDMVCRSLMLALHRAGHIELPAKRQAPPNNAIAHRRVVAGATYETTPLAGSLASLGALTIRLVRRTEDETLFAQLLRDHHYLGYSRPVGEHLKYLVVAGERPLACLAWSSAPLQLDLRDRFVGAPQGRLSPQSSPDRLQLPLFDSAVGRGAASGQPPAGADRPAHQRRLAGTLRPSPPTLRELRGYRALPGHLL